MLLTGGLNPRAWRPRSQRFMCLFWILGDIFRSGDIGGIAQTPWGTASPGHAVLCCFPIDPGRSKASIARLIGDRAGWILASGATMVGLIALPLRHRPFVDR